MRRVYKRELQDEKDETDENKFEVEGQKLGETRSRKDLLIVETASANEQY
jgi:hypothetical protein